MLVSQTCLNPSQPPFSPLLLHKRYSLLPYLRYTDTRIYLPTVNHGSPPSLPRYMAPKPKPPKTRPALTTPVAPAAKLKTRRIAIANQKGGTAKSTTAVNLAGGLTRRGKRVLLVDVDPQANATSVFLTAQFTLGPAQDVNTSYEVVVLGAPIHEAVYTIDLPANERDGYAGGQLDILPAHIKLARAEMELIGVLRREDRLSAALNKVDGDYDFVIIDCPPSLGLLTLNALMAAHEVLIPVEPGVFPMMGIAMLKDTITDVAKVNGVRILGAIPTLQDRTNESKETLEALHQIFGKNVFPAIPRRVAFRDAHSAQIDIFGYIGAGEAAVAAMELVKEVERRG